MFRSCLLLFGLTLSTLLFANGCQSCSSCHDYDPPVPNCHCGHCPQCGCNSGCTSGCGSCGCNGSSSTSGGYMQPGETVEAPVEGQVISPNGNAQPTNAR